MAQIPKIIELCGNSSIILKKTLLATSPNEACALLIGTKDSDNTNNELQFKIHTIWPCCNIWENGKFDDIEIKQKRNQLSKKNRFAIDPREQILAQKWARSNQLNILGSAHSHPNTYAIPSKIDLYLNRCPNLMIIVDNAGIIRGWWISNSENCQEIEVAFNSKLNL
tara:strand:+ start:895 stop:1395 length:501 start_codon:yes stop_codon:yes gene_type:complete